MPLIQGAAGTLENAYAQSQGGIQGASDSLTGLLPGLIDRYQQGDPTLNAAGSYTRDVLGGNYLDSNPYTDGMVDRALNRSTNATQAALGNRGLTGGSAYADIISRNNANASLDFYGRDYENERNRMAQAASMAPGQSAAQSALLQPAFQSAQASFMPLQAAGQYAGGIGGLLGGYGAQTNKPSTMDTIMGIGGTALSAAALFSDRRLKDDIHRVGFTDGGLPIYTYRYKGEERTHMGVMADEVQEKQPEALGPKIAGFSTVLYGEVR